MNYRTDEGVIMELNNEQKWLKSRLASWPSGAEAVTRGPFDQILEVYPRKCTSAYCLTKAQYQSAAEVRHG